MGERPPYTHDPILREYKFCNVYRVCDRVSQFLIRNVIYDKPRSELDTLMRIFLFRLLNKSESWVEMERRVGPVDLKTFDSDRYAQALDELRKEGKPIYGNAFILCANKSFGFERKHQNHLALIDMVFNKSETGKKLVGAKSLQRVFEVLRDLPLIGDFMAYQIAMDFNYSEVFDFDENEFTRAGPGAVRGIDKCFEDKGGRSYDEVIRWMVTNQEREFEKLGLSFRNLGGRPLKAIDCQGLFCEVDKYCRMKFPDLASARKRIKMKFVPGEQFTYFFPPKWGIDSPVP